jgi:5-methylcytosine-specific restriction endonuclease McrA
MSFRSLLLNSSFEPMRIVTWQKALILWFQEKVEVLEYHTAYARSSRSRFQLPSVLKLKVYVRPKNKNSVRFCRENVYLRDDYRCQYCGDRFAPKLLTLDHVVPASKQGVKSWTNVVTACRDCNQRKANRTPHQAKMPLLTEPEIPHWLPFSDYEFKRGQIPDNWLQYLNIDVSF